MLLPKNVTAVMFMVCEDHGHSERIGRGFINQHELMAPSLYMYTRQAACLNARCCCDKSARSCLSGPLAAFSAHQICRCPPASAERPRHRPQVTFYSCVLAVAVIKVVDASSPSYEQERMSYIEPAVELWCFVR